MSFISGLILVLSFVGLVVYSIKGHNLMIGFILMATLWTIVPIINQLVAGNSISVAVEMLQAVYQRAPENWGGVLVNVFFGAWFGRVLLDTEIASTIIRKSVELGGDNSALILVLVSLITGIIFTSLTGAGPVISIAVVVLPILFSIGIPKGIALFSYTGSVAAGIFLNPINFTQYRAFFDIEGATYTYADYFPFGLAAFAVMLVIIAIFSLIYMKREAKLFQWEASTAATSTVKNAPNLALITPFLPVIGVIFLRLPMILCFILSGLFALVICQELTADFRSISRMLTKQYADAVKDTASLVGFWLCLAMFNAAASFAGPYFQSILGGIIPQSTILLCLMFIFLSPFTWFRGPMNLVGSGAAILAVISQQNAGWPVEFLYPLFISILIGMGHFDITTSWVSWGLGYAQVEGKSYMKMAFIPGIVICIVLELLTYFWFG